MVTQRIYADFNCLDDDNRLRLDRAGTLADLARHGVELGEGMRLTFYMDDADDSGVRDDLLADGVVTRGHESGAWVAVVDWDTVRHASARGDANGAVVPGRRTYS